MLSEKFKGLKTKLVGWIKKVFGIKEDKIKEEFALIGELDSK